MGKLGVRLFVMYLMSLFSFSLFLKYIFLKDLHIVLFINSYTKNREFIYSYKDVPSLIARTKENRAKIRATKI
jgi:hypothetical protein